MTAFPLFEDGPTRGSPSTPRGKSKMKPKRLYRDRTRLSPKTLERLRSRERVYVANFHRKEQDSADFDNNHRATLDALCKVTNQHAIYQLQIRRQISSDSWVSFASAGLFSTFRLLVSDDLASGDLRPRFHGTVEHNLPNANQASDFVRLMGLFRIGGSLFNFPPFGI